MCKICSPRAAQEYHAAATVREPGVLPGFQTVGCAEVAWLHETQAATLLVCSAICIATGVALLAIGQVAGGCVDSPPKICASDPSRTTGRPTMNYWRMAMRCGTQGPDMFPECRKRGIAAIGYRDTVEDCRKLGGRDGYQRAFRSKWCVSGSAYRSLEHLAFDMMPGDVIYVKHGPQIAGKGVVTDGYAYDPNILRGTKCPWGHFLRVVWEQDFPTFECLLGAEPVPSCQSPANAWN